MIFERTIREALTPPPSNTVQVKPYTRKRPNEAKRKALHERLEAEVRPQ